MNSGIADNRLTGTPIYYICEWDSENPEIPETPDNAQEETSEESSEETTEDASEE